MSDEVEKRKSGQLSRRDFGRIAVFTSGAVAGAFLDRIVRALIDQSQESRPELEFFTYVGDGFIVIRDRYDDEVFIIQDTRGGNTLPPDRKEYLFRVLRQLQVEFDCTIGNAVERPQFHDLQIVITNPECLFDRNAE